MRHPCPTPSLSLLTPGSCRGRYLRQASPTSRLSPSRPPRATLEEPEGMAKGVRLGGPRGGGLGGGLVWRPGVLPLFAEDEEGRQG
jgi:hypothetical protein